jgi:hypothetical protein
MNRPADLTGVLSCGAEVQRLAVRSPVTRPVQFAFRPPAPPPQQLLACRFSPSLGPSLG